MSLLISHTGDSNGCRENLSRSFFLCFWDIWPAIPVMREMLGQKAHGHFCHDKVIDKFEFDKTYAGKVW